MMDRNYLYKDYAKIVKSLSLYLEEHKKQDPPFFLLSHSLPSIYFPDLNTLNDIKKNDFDTDNSKLAEEKTDEIQKNNFVHLKENVRCNLCSEKVYAVKNYFKKPESTPYPILVVYYNGSFNTKNLPKDNSDKYYFSSEEEDDIFNRMLGAINLTIKNIFFQEFVACHFSPASTKEEWEKRVNNCLYLLEKNVFENNIQKLLLVGNAALLLLGDEAIRIAKNSQIITLNIQQKEFPAMVIRSPLALLTIEKKRKEYQNHLQKFKEEYETFLKNKNQIDRVLQNILNELPQQNQNVKIVNNIKLIRASEIQSEKQIEEKIKKHLGIGKYFLYMALKYRKEEILVKQQMLNSLKLLISDK